jgi:hypothetical protein
MGTFVKACSKENIMTVVVACTGKDKMLLMTALRCRSRLTATTAPLS